MCVSAPQQLKQMVPQPPTSKGRIGLLRAQSLTRNKRLQECWATDALHKLKGQT